MNFSLIHLPRRIVYSLVVLLPLVLLLLSFPVRAFELLPGVEVEETVIPAPPGSSRVADESGNETRQPKYVTELTPKEVGEFYKDWAKENIPKWSFEEEMQDTKFGWGGIFTSTTPPEVGVISIFANSKWIGLDGEEGGPDNPTTVTVITNFKKNLVEGFNPIDTGTGGTKPLEKCVNDKETESARQGIIKIIGKTYGFNIRDSDYCGDSNICGDNSLWSIEQLTEMESLLGRLPKCFLDELVELKTVSGLAKSRLLPPLSKLATGTYLGGCCKGREPGLLALAFSPESLITVCDKHYVGKYNLAYVLAHEFTHALTWHNIIVPDFCKNHPFCMDSGYTNPLVINWLKETGWMLDGICLPFLGCPGAKLKVPSDLPTDYARKTKSPFEDMSESVALYVDDPETLLGISPRRYNFVKDHIMCNQEFL